MNMLFPELMNLSHRWLMWMFISVKSREVGIVFKNKRSYLQKLLFNSDSAQRLIKIVIFLCFSSVSRQFSVERRGTSKKTEIKRCG